MFKVLLFDLNDTVLRHDYFGMFITGLKHLKLGIIPALVKAKKCKDIYSLGRISSHEFFEKVLHKKHKDLIDLARSLYRQHIYENPGILDLIYDLRKMGYRTVMLAGDGFESVYFKRKDFFLDEYFEKIIATCDLGILKNNPLFYKKALHLINASPEDCLFIDNQLNYIKAARKAGIKSIRFRSLKKLKKDLERALEKKTLKLYP